MSKIEKTLWTMLVISCLATLISLWISLKSRQDIVNYFCDDMETWICVSEDCRNELNKREIMCNEIK